MKIFLDTADLEEIREYAATGLVDGVTTNPSLAAKTGRGLCRIAEGDLRHRAGPGQRRSAGHRFRRHDEGSQAVFDQDRQEHRDQGAADLGRAEGLPRAVRATALMVNVTLCFSPVQAMMAAKAGATFISPFIGRVDDAGEDGMGLIRDIRAIYDNYGFKTEILAASIRSVSHVRECGAGRRRCRHHADRDLQEAAQPSPDRQGPGGLPRRRQEGERGHQGLSG